MRHHTAIFVVGGLLAVGWIPTVATAARASGSSGAATSSPYSSLMGQSANEFFRMHGYRPLDGVATFYRAKGHAREVAAARSSGASGAFQFGPTVPLAAVGASWKGVSSSSATPPDSNGAIGPSSFVQTINGKVGIYSRTGVAIATGSLKSLAGDTATLSDPMVLWDPNTQRFYYSMFRWTGGNAFNSPAIDFGFSKSSNPTSVGTSDWCPYQSNFGWVAGNIGDYPKLGQTADFLLIGENFYPTPSSQESTQSDLLWVTKPQGSGTISTCPSGGSFTAGKFTDLRNEDNTQAFTPVPAIQTDPSSTGYVVAMSDIECPPNCGTGTTLTAFTVTNDGGVPALSAPDSMTVGAYQNPPDAPQAGSTNTIDTLDGRLTHAVSGFDPRIGATTVWVAHTVLGGAGSAVRWYEVNPTPTGSATVAQTGKVAPSGAYTYNAGISNDRTCTETTCAHGDSMVVGFTKSSSSLDPKDQWAFKLGANAQQMGAVVKSSGVPDKNFGCSPCRWGDYGGAAPDPAADLLATHGEVWLSQQWTTGGGVFSSGDQTWNWEVKL